MKKQHCVIMILIMAQVVFSCAGHPDRQKIRLIQSGDSFPETTLAVPTDPKSRLYLGISGKQNFTIEEVEADLIVVEILSVYCPSCQRQMGAYNKLFQLIENDPMTRGRVKMIGIAAGNTQTEAARFVRLFDVRFPIIPDPRYDFYNAIGETRAPFTIYARQRPGRQAAIVAKTHFGLNLQYKAVFEELQQILAIDVASLPNAGSKNAASQPMIMPVLTKNELEKKIAALFTHFGIPAGPIKKLALTSSRNVYSGLIDQKGERLRLFAEAVSRPPVCIDCHDIHFIYAFDSSGRVIGFEPIHLTKYGNELWSQDDIDRMRGRLIGRRLSDTVLFQPTIDAVSSATITSGVIFNSLSKGKSLLEELKTKGLI